MITISNSEIAMWQRCHRQWFITYYLGFVPATEPAASNKQLGSRVHTALEGYYGYQLDPLAVLGLLYRFEIEKKPDEAAELMAEREMAQIMVGGYLEWLAEEGEDADLEVVATETDLQIPLPGVEGVALRARMDQAGLRRSDGLLYFLDYKTAPGFEKHEYLHLDPQFKFYALMQQLAVRGNPGAPRIAGGCVSTLRRVKRTSRSEPPYYARDWFRYTDTELASTHLRVQHVCKKILDARKALDWCYGEGKGDLDLVNSVQQSLLPPTPIVHDCRWSCALASGLCTMMDDGSDWAASLTKSGRFRQEDPYTYYRNDSLRTIREALAAA